MLSVAYLPERAARENPFLTGLPRHNVVDVAKYQHDAGKGSKECECRRHPESTAIVSKAISIPVLRHRTKPLCSSVIECLARLPSSTSPMLCLRNDLVGRMVGLCH